MKNKYLVFFAFLITTLLFSNAQFIPTRDRSKDKPSVSKGNNKPIKNNGKGGKNNKDLKKKNSSSLVEKPDIVEAPIYVYINGKQYEILESTYNGGTFYFSYSSNTDSGLSYEYRNPEDNHYTGSKIVPSWCHFQNCEGAYFSLTIDPNMSTQGRGAIFRILDKYSNDAQLAIYQKPHPVGEISNATIRHNVNIGQYKYLEITANYTLNYAINLDIGIVAYLQDEQGTYIKCKTNHPFYNYRLTNTKILNRCELFRSQSSDTEGILYSQQIINPNVNYQNGQISIQIPNDAMELWKKNSKITCHLFLYDISSGEYFNRGYRISFKAKKKKDTITTEQL